MTSWIRSPAWDGFWLLSGLPIGAALTLAALRLPTALMIFWIVLLIQTGHTIAPMAVAWGHGEFRAMMLRRRPKFVALPLVILAAALVAGWVGNWSLRGIHFNPNSFSIAEGPRSFADLGNPFLAMVAIYALWNGWHFGRQNFGVISLYRRKYELAHSAFGAGRPDTMVIPKSEGVSLRLQSSRQSSCFARFLGALRSQDKTSSRQKDLIFCCGVTWATMLMPFIPRLAHGLNELTGFPAHPHPFLDRFEPAYFALAAVAVLLMLWGERGRFCLPRLVLILTQGAGLVLVWFAGLWGLAIVAINHWLSAIGLASLISNGGKHEEDNNRIVQRREANGRDFSQGSRDCKADRKTRSIISDNYRRSHELSSGIVAWRICFGGALLFVALFVNPFDIGVMGRQTFTEPQYILHFTVIAVAFRLGLGFVHFLYDRWLYRRSSPIMKTLLA